jgi:hypothetical protein
VRTADEAPGDVGDDEADEADQAADGDGGGGGQRGGDDDQQPQPAGMHTQGSSLVVTDREHVEGTSAEEQHDERRAQVGQNDHDVRPLCLAQLAEEPAVDLAQVVGVLLLDQGLARGEERGDRDAGQQQGRAVRPAGGGAQRQRAPDADERSGEGGQRDDADRAHGLDGGVGDDQGGAEAGAGRRSEEVGVGERVPEDALIGGARDGQAGADEGGEQDAGESQLQQHRLLRAAEAAGHLDSQRPQYAVEQGRDDAAGGQRQRADPHPDQEGDDERQPRPGEHEARPAAAPR